MRAIFMGTPETAVPALEALTQEFEVVGVVCQPDRPVGRGLHEQAPPVKARAQQLGLEVNQPVKVRTGELRDWVLARAPDLILVMAYGRILPPDILAAAPHGCLNLHASILPRYRGAAPIQWAILRGESETGISLMQMDAGMDTGPVHLVRRLAIGANETSDELAARLSQLAASVVRDDLGKVLGAPSSPAPQSEAEATSAPMLRKEDGRIDWSWPAHRVHDHVRGMFPWPSAYTRAGTRTLKVLATRHCAFEGGHERPGTVLLADSGGVFVQCGQGVLELVRAQAEGRKAMSCVDLVHGRAIALGMRLE